MLGSTDRIIKQKKLLHQPVRRGQILLLLELLLQPHQLHLGEDGAAAARLLEARRAALRLRLAADAERRLARRRLRAARRRRQQGQMRGGGGGAAAGWGRHLLGEVVVVGRLAGDDGEEGVGP